jgi:hypothetical protein
MPFKPLWHFFSAALNSLLEVSIPLVSKTGPLPVVLGAGTSMPFWRKHAAYLASPARAEALLRRPAPPRGKLPPPHFFSAA